MTMTKKDYELVASAIKRTIQITEMLEKNKIRKQAKLDAIKLVANDLAGTLHGDNPRFQRDRFLQECGITK